MEDDMECDSVEWIVNKVIMPLYLDTAKTFMNLSSAALLLTIVFREKIVGSQPGTRVDRLMILSWLCFLLTIGASAFYQYLAVKFLDSLSCAPGSNQHFEYLVKDPGNVYGVMLVLFFVAATLLVATAWKHLPKKGG
jgi:hypothetical protein